MAKKETLGAYLNRNIKELGSSLSKEKAKGKKYKSISAAKKAGALYYTNKAGKIMAAVYGEDLKVRPAASELMNSGIKVTKLDARSKADSPGKGSDEAITYKGGAAAQKKGANTPNKRGTAGADGFGTRTKVAQSAPKPKNGSSPKPITSKDKDKVKKNKGGPVTKKPKGAYAAGGMTKKSGYMYGGMAKKKAKK